MPNRLAHETSPYLLQHAHNPVDWYPWGEDALTKAVREDKPILVSIGYSACHWCHVMERESFEREQIATIMNERFVCIKVDREERPDVDAIYMDAVQAMGVRGGWPLNVFLLPDARPFYGVTYLPPQQWVNLLVSVRNAFDEHRDQLIESAEGFTNELNLSDSVRFGLTDSSPQYRQAVAETLFEQVATKFDREKGGLSRAPKFPMPSIYTFLLAYHQLTADERALNQLTLTLDRMALGGIYDQSGGGFARYSVDEDWFAPHFEKMLYDNGQLLSLYADAWRVTGNPLYKQTVYQTIAFAQRELLSPEGGFYSALDADSEGEEGKFYTWTTAELRDILGSDFEWFADLYSIEEDGNWEHETGHGKTGRNILHRTLTDEQFAQRADWTVAELHEMLAGAHQKLMAVRATRIRPGLDDKILCSWNGLMLKGLVSAYRAFAEPHFLTLALRLAHFLLHNMRDKRNRNAEPGRLWHTYKKNGDAPGRAKQAAFLEDYAAVIDGLLALYQATFTESWLREADALTQYVLGNFADTDSDPLLFFTDKNAEDLIARRKELFDNVVPASNSIMAGNLLTLSTLLDRPAYAELADRMLGRIGPLLEKNPDYLTNWAALYTRRVLPSVEIAIIGPEADAYRRELESHLTTGVLFCGLVCNTPNTCVSDLPLLRDRTMRDGQTTIYVCHDRACQLPVTSVAEAIKLL
ncbi:thioredoxin domain-containing protein [Rudanella lutea]|uniref:thioredoxin domain-containing protein n=1 Tax=Rudanella lutea TaxID=451374 RepID=UPI000376B6AC|nr:thioredoxin domain-containing protein [Rudanella lutea]